MLYNYLQCNPLTVWYLTNKTCSQTLLSFYPYLNCFTEFSFQLCIEVLISYWITKLEDFSLEEETMPIKKNQSSEGGRSIRLQIFRPPSVDSSNLHDLGGSFFEPQRETSYPTPIGMQDADNINKNYWERAPEKKLIIFAIRLAILEKAASGLGALGFIWATAVLLGGFASLMDRKDFWFVTVILLTVGNKIFSQSHELDWQHQATWTITDAGKHSFQKIASSFQFFIHVIKVIFQPFSAIKPQSAQHQHIANDIQIITQTQVPPPTRQHT